MFILWYALRVLAIIAIVLVVAYVMWLLAPAIGMKAATWIGGIVVCVTCLPIAFLELVLMFFRRQRT